MRPFFCVVVDPSSPFATELADAFDRYGPSILRHCTMQLGNRETARDVVQDTFLRTWEYYRSGHKVENLKTFLYRVANNLVIDELRRRKRKEDVSLDDLQERGIDFGRSDLEGIHQRLDVWRTLTDLRKKEYDLLIMRFYDGMGPREIAHKTGLAPNTVAVRLHRTIKHLTRKFFRRRREKKQHLDLRH